MKIFEPNFKTFIASIDGSPKPLSPLFDEIYHEDFEYRGKDGDFFDKQQLKQYQTNAFECGTKAELLSYKEIDADHVEFKFHKVNEKYDVIVWNVAELKENKIVSVTPYDEESEGSIKKIRQVWSKDAVDATKDFEQNFKAWIASMDGAPKPLSPLFDVIVHEEFEYRGKDGHVFHYPQIKQCHTNAFECGTKATLLSFKKVDADHVEFKVRKIANDKFDIIVWNVAQLKEGKIAKVTPYNEESGESVKQIRQIWGVDGNGMKVSSKEASSESTDVNVAVNDDAPQ